MDPRAQEITGNSSPQCAAGTVKSDRFPQSEFLLVGSREASWGKTLRTLKGERSDESETTMIKKKLKIGRAN